MTLGHVASKIPVISGIVASVLMPLTTVWLLATNTSSFGNLSLIDLSNLGEEGEATQALFNVSLIIGGTLTALFAIGLVTRLPLVGKPGFALFLADSVALTGVGVFNIPSPFHNPSATAFFTLLPFALLAMGLHLVKSTIGKVGVLKTIGLGTLASAAVLFCLGLLMILFYPSRGLAILELAAMFTSSFWLLVFGRKLVMSTTN